jgi:hypothetical protein
MWIVERGVPVTWGNSYTHMSGLIRAAPPESLLRRGRRPIPIRFPFINSKVKQRWVFLTPQKKREEKKICAVERKYGIICIVACDFSSYLPGSRGLASVFAAPRFFFCSFTIMRVFP